MLNPEPHVVEWSSTEADAEAVELARRLGVVPFFRSRDAAVLCECAMILIEQCPTRSQAEAVIREAAKATRWNGAGQLREIAIAMNRPPEPETPDPFAEYPEDLRRRMHDAHDHPPQIRERLCEQILEEYRRRIEAELHHEPAHVQAAVAAELETMWNEFMRYPRLLTPAQIQDNRRRIKLYIYRDHYRGRVIPPPETKEKALFPKTAEQPKLRQAPKSKPKGATPANDKRTVQRSTQTSKPPAAGRGGRSPRKIRRRD